MTARKTKRYSPYTCNVQVQGQESSDRLKQELKAYFDQDVDWKSLEDEIVKAIGNYGLSAKLNPHRKNRAEQLKDREELIGCLHELSERLHYWHIPPTVWEDAKESYAALPEGEPTLAKEIAEILKRTERVKKIFEQTRVPFSVKTNPGTPEIKALRKVLSDIYLKFTSRAQIDERKNFTNDGQLNFTDDVLRIFFLK